MNVSATVKMNQGEYEEFGAFMGRLGVKLDLAETTLDSDGNPFMHVRLHDQQISQWQAFYASSSRGQVMGIADHEERVRQMRKSGEFTDSEIEAEVMRIYDHDAQLGERVAREARVLGLAPLPEPEPKRPETAEELYGGPAYIQQALPDGRVLSRPATPEELKAARQSAIVGAGSYDAQMRALKADPTAFDD